MLRAALLAALVAELILVVPSTAQVGSGKIAFSPGSDQGGILTANPDGTGLTAIRPSGRGATWSPDGSRIAFADRPANEVFTRLYVMNADGSAARLVAATPPPSLSNQAWSPDGEQIAFGGTEFRDNNIAYRDLYVADVASGALRRLTSVGTLSGSPSWSPTGSEIVFSARVPATTSSTHLFVIDTNGGTPKRITQDVGGPAIDLSPTWSPDGRRIAFLRGIGSGTSVSVVRADGTELRRLAGIGEHLTDVLAWSPDGTRIAFSTAVNGAFSFWGRAGREIFVVSADGSAESRLTHGGPLFMADWSPVWSPDGERLLFLRNHDAGRDGIYTMNADGTCEGKLAVGDRGVPSWQPLPGAPPLGPKRCHALAIDAEAPVRVDGSRATITATVVNDGTEPLSGIEFLGSVSSAVTLMSAEVQSQPGSCRIVRSSVACSIAKLERGGSAQISVEAVGQRVTSVSNPRFEFDVRLKLSLLAFAAETLLPTNRESAEIRFSVDRCTAASRGGGEVVGTPHRDHLCGRRGADRITPLGHRDTVEAGAGNDLVLAREGTRDVIRCGPGRDRVVVDRLDSVARDCERVDGRRVKRPPPYGPG